MKDEPTELNPSSLNTEGQGENQNTETDFGTGEDFMSRLETDLDKELSDKVPAKMDAEAQVKDIEAKGEKDQGIDPNVSPKENTEAEAETEDSTETDKGAGKDTEPKDSKEADSQEEDPDKEVLNAEPPGGKHASQETKVNWKKLQEVARKAKEEATAIKAEASKIKEQLAEIEKTKDQATIPKEIEQEINYLRTRVAELDLSSSPQFKQKYDSQVEKIEAGLLSEFQKIEDTGAKGAKDLTSKLKGAISEAGGITKYNWPALLDLCEEHKLINGIQRRKIEGQVANAETIEDQKKQELSQATEFFQQSKEKTAQERQALVQNMDTKIREYTAKPGNEWTLLPKDPGAKAPDEEKKAYKDALDFYNQGTARFKKMVNGLLNTYGVAAGDEKVTPDEFIDIAFDSIKAMRIGKDLEAKEAEVKTLTDKVTELEEELSKFRKAGNTTSSKSTPKSGSSARVDKQAPINRTEILDTIDGDLEKFINNQ
jgi:hypothetical protein